jgi:hypothetical protein
VDIERVEPPGRPALLWFALLGGPVAWSAHLLASYPLVRVACNANNEMILHSVTIVTVALAALAGFVGWREWHRLDREAESEAEALVLRRARFMALSGAVLGGFFAVVTIAEGLPVFFGDPCLRGP